MSNFQNTKSMKKMKFFSGIAVAALLLGTSFTSCKSNDDPDPYAGKTDPTTIATANLVAYFPFNGNGNDTIGLLTPKTKPNVTFTTARRGKGYQGVDNAYFLYDLPTASKLRTLKAFSISMWLKEPQISNDVPPVPMILQIKNDDDLFWGNLSLTQDRMGSTLLPIDSLNLKMVIHKEGVAWNNQFIGFANPAFQAAKWMHIIFEYDNVSSTYNVFVNGAKLTLNAGITNRFAAEKPATGVQPPLGDLVFNKASQIVIGGWLPKILNGATDEWMGWFKGQMDELRIYDRALTTTEAKALYDAEVTVIN